MNKKKKKVYKEKSPVRKLVGNILWHVTFALALGVFLISAGLLLHQFLEYKKGSDEYQALADLAVRPAGDEPADEKESPDEGESLETDSEEPGVEEMTGTGSEELIPEDFTPVPLQIDFDSLREINQDVRGWLYLEGLEISYPIVQGSDNDWYLHRTYEGMENSAGSIFMDYLNAGDFSDANTIIYGHNMKNQTMFGRLKFLDTQQKIQNCKEFWILTPERDMRFRIVSAFYVNENSQIYTIYSPEATDFGTYVSTCLSMNQLPLVQPEPETVRKLVTLSTCAARDSSDRFVVQGMLVQSTRHE